MKDKNRICPVERAGSLDTIFRRWIQNPRKILQPYIEDGMTVLDVGCGPGFFTIEMARLVGASGRVIACDVQDGMLRKLSAKVKGSRLENSISLRKCTEESIGIAEAVDFILAFYMLHEVPHQEKYLEEMYSLLKPAGRVLVVEPTFRVSKSEFNETVNRAKAAGLAPVESPKIIMGRTAVLKKG